MKVFAIEPMDGSFRFEPFVPNVRNKGMDLYQELRDVTEAFLDADIDYAVCGGMAVAIHGYPRFTKDLDFLVLEDDMPRIRTAVKNLGYTLPAGPIPFGVGTDATRRIYRISKVIGSDVFTLDFLIVSAQWSEAWETRRDYELEDGAVLTVVSREGLLHMKRLAGRLQDQLDLQNLEKQDER
ncbi:MAG: hypothetical protein E2P02_11880 [Acidobacteria bacterium]|nr:MAG: hypothetical protein E2P02_11880 [Acidobacteriota bacterium]